MENYRKLDLGNKMETIGIRPLDIMVTGATGAGKSTTLNSFFKKEVARVGAGADPETMDINSYRLHDYLRLWDTPGLGDGISQDKKHSKKMIDLLYKTYNINDYNFGFIDLVLVVLDGGGRDMGTTYDLLNNVIIPNFQKSRILVAINQADLAMKGRYWDEKRNRPLAKLIDFLEQKVRSIQERVFEATGVSIIKPIYYSAEYNYNIDKLFDLIIDNMALEKRSLVLN